MRRISSLPTAEFCPKVDKIGRDVESTQSARSTIFHAYCDTGEWSEDIKTLPEADIEEIQKWKVPFPFVYTAGDVTYALQYRAAIREARVALDSNFEFVDIPTDVAIPDIPEKFPHVMVFGHLDMAWTLPEHDLVIVCDIKSSIYAVKDRTESLQLHGYGYAMCKKLGIGRYVTAIWDASDGRYYVNAEAVEIDGFEAANIMDRIKLASAERDGDFRTGIHCSGCWKRKRCPAHLGGVPSDSEFEAILSGDCTEADVRQAIIRLKQLGDLTNEVADAVKGWVSRHGYVRSEDGTKVYRCEMRAGRESLDKAAVARALGRENLDEFMRRGKDFPVFEWRKAE